jgi:iron complex transport system permease protein
MIRTERPLLALVLLLAFVSAMLSFALVLGSEHLALADIWAALNGRGEALTRSIVLDLRLERALAALATGGLLALAGALMQVLLRNPLADPYVLGVSGGAAVAALGSLMLGLSGVVVEGAAFAGALAAMLLVFGLARGPGGWSSTRLLLTGAVVAAGLGAVISLLLALGPDSSLRGMLFWLMGDLSVVQSAKSALAALAIACAATWPLGRSLNVLAQGEQQALLLGVPARGLRIGIYILGSLFTAVAVTFAGSIGFVGLIVPHTVRLLAGPDHRILLPASALAGGALLVFADTLARTVFAPRQLPVGAITALIGVPIFLVLVRRQQPVV